MGILKDKGICNNTKSKSVQVFESLFPNFLEVDADTPRDYVQKYWDAFQQNGPYDNSLNGKIFELVIMTLLYREGVVPYYKLNINGVEYILSSCDQVDNKLVEVYNEI